MSVQSWTPVPAKVALLDAGLQPCLLGVPMILWFCDLSVKVCATLLLGRPPGHIVWLVSIFISFSSWWDSADRPWTPFIPSRYQGLLVDNVTSPQLYLLFWDLTSTAHGGTWLVSSHREVSCLVRPESEWKLMVLAKYISVFLSKKI